MIPHLTTLQTVATVVTVYFLICLMMHLLKIRFNKRKWWHFGNNRKCINIEVAGFWSGFSISLTFDGQDEEIQFHIGCGLSFWLTFEGFWPTAWYPKEKNEYSETGYTRAERDIRVAIHDYAIWFDVWADPMQWNSSDPWWMHFSWHPFRDLRGKHTVIRNVISSAEFILPFLEGNYHVIVDMIAREDRYKRWFTRYMTTWEIRCGYYLIIDNVKTFIVVGIPHEGKGESDYDQGEDATSAMSCAPKGLTTHFQVALYFWKSMMEQRERYGGKNWRPDRFDGTPITVISPSPPKPNPTVREEKNNLGIKNPNKNG